MNASEAVRLVAEARACYPGMSVPVGMPEAWHGLIGDLTFADCHDALMRHARSSSQIITPADVRKIVTAAQNDRVMRAAVTSGRGDGRTTKPEWFGTVMRQHKAASAPHWAGVWAGKPSRPARSSGMSSLNDTTRQEAAR